MLVSNRPGPAEWPGFFLPIHWLIPELTHQLCIKGEHKLKGTSKYWPLAVTGVALGYILSCCRNGSRWSARAKPIFIEAP